MERINISKKLESKAIALEKIKGGDIKTSGSQWKESRNGVNVTVYYRDSWNNTNCDGIFDCNESGCERLYENIAPSSSVDICSLP